MTPEGWADTRAAWRAECKGDLITALRCYERVPSYHGSPHHGLLRQLAELVDDLPAWAWGRWVAYLNGRQGVGDEEDARHQRAIERTLLAVYADVCHSVLPGGQDPQMFVVEVIGKDWVYRQLRTYEYGGLGEFIEHGDVGRLIARTDEHLAEWVDARMGGYQVDEGSRSSVLITDLATGRTVDVLDLGAEFVTHPGGFVLGRLVPIADTPGLMFESKPLEVDEQTAREVAALEGEPTDAWVDVLARARREGRLERGFSQTVVESIVTDVHSVGLLAAGTLDHEIAGTVERLNAGEDEVGDAAFRLLGATWLIEVRARDEPAACMPLLAAAILRPGVFDRAQGELTQSHRRPGWAWCANVAPEPARGRFLALAALSDHVERSAS